jgi:hypothetical protein
MHRRRAQEWWDSLPESSAFSSQTFTSPDRERRSSTALRGSVESTALADLVPMFVSLSAARGEMHGEYAANITRQWMELAGEFMLQAALEQCLVYGTSSSSKLREIFSWGWRPSPTQVNWEDEIRVNRMFCEEGRQQEVAGWADIRREYIGMVRPLDVGLDFVRLIMLSNSSPHHVVFHCLSTCRTLQRNFHWTISKARSSTSWTPYSNHKTLQCWLNWRPVK